MAGAAVTRVTEALSERAWRDQFSYLFHLTEEETEAYQGLRDLPKLTSLGPTMGNPVKA